MSLRRLSASLAVVLAVLAVPRSPLRCASAFVIPSSHRGSSRTGCGSLVRVNIRGTSSDSLPYGEAAYDPAAADDYFRNHPLDALGRLVQLSSLSGGFILALILDRAFGKADDAVTVDRRSQQLLRVVVDLGPAFIKVGQALSIRTDFLPAPYAKGLTELQDSVPPFSSARGRQIVERELNVRIADVFAEFSPEPVASASIGQVYKATLRDQYGGGEVAVKVQRPNVLRDVALDIYIMRRLAPLYLKMNGDSNTDLVGLIDAWGTGFIDELDYCREATATTAFSVAMRDRGLGSVIAPEVMSSLSSTRVLTTRWVNGNRLDVSNTDDVPRLCGVALNAYLTMLLDTGTLHCDPHPGNLLRTPEGKLCILDFGMCLEVPKDLQLALLEFIADLQAENYERVPDDLVNLGFVPPGKIDDLRASGLTYGIAQMLRFAGEGGGPKGAMEKLVEENKAKYKAEDGSELPTKERQRQFREDWMKEMAKDAMAREKMGSETSGGSVAVDLTNKIEQIQQQNSNVFAIPEYFVYMARAFATLEGIGLSADPSYTILKECFPYLAKRLLSDDSPRARGALQTLLYGDGEEINLTKLRDITDGLESYTTSTASVESSRGSNNDGKSVAAEQLAAVLLSEENNYVQSLLLREAAVALDTVARDAVSSSVVFDPLRRLPLPPVLSPFAPLFAPITLPLELAKAVLELQETDKADEKRLENVRVLTDLATKATSRGITDRERAGFGLSPAVGPVGSGVDSLLQNTMMHRRSLTRIGVRFFGQIASTQAERLRRKGDEHGGKELSRLAERLATEGANGLDLVAERFEDADRTLTNRKLARSTTE